MAMLDCNNVYADGTACINSISAFDVSSIVPSEFSTEENEAMFHEYLCGIAPLVIVPQKASMPLDVNCLYTDVAVYADGTSCIDSSIRLNLDPSMPQEFDESENEASLHEYLCDIAPLVEVPQKLPTPLDFNNVYGDGTTCMDNCPTSNINPGLPCEFTEPENEASFHGYLCGIAPLVEVPQTPPTPLDSNNVYADGTMSIDSISSRSVSQSSLGLPCEFTEPENEASFHDYLCSIAPPVMVKGDSKVPLERSASKASPPDQLQGA